MQVIVAFCVELAYNNLKGVIEMTINEYQKLAMTTLNPDLNKKDVLINGVMGLCGESGEVIDIVKKHLHQGHELDKEKIVKELGDVAWYLAEIAYALGVDWMDVRGRYNVCKIPNTDLYAAALTQEKEGS